MDFNEKILDVMNKEVWITYDWKHPDEHLFCCPIELLYKFRDEIDWIYLFMNFPVTEDFMNKTELFVDWKLVKLYSSLKDERYLSNN